MLITHFSHSGISNELEGLGQHLQFCFSREIEQHCFYDVVFSLYYYQHK